MRISLPFCDAPFDFSAFDSLFRPPEVPDGSSWVTSFAFIQIQPACCVPFFL